MNHECTAATQRIVPRVSIVPPPPGVGSRPRLWAPRHTADTGGARARVPRHTPAQREQDAHRFSVRSDDHKRMCCWVDRLSPRIGRARPAHAAVRPNSPAWPASLHLRGQAGAGPLVAAATASAHKDHCKDHERSDPTERMDRVAKREGREDHREDLASGHDDGEGDGAKSTDGEVDEELPGGRCR